MTFMEDSERAADFAKSDGTDVGLHLNLTEALSDTSAPSRLLTRLDRVSRFLKKNKYALLFYNPALREDFKYLYQAELDEFLRLYGVLPTHIDGHQHMHLCTNLLLEAPYPAGQRVRRNFSFARGEKQPLNIAYRATANWWLSRRYRLTDYFFSLSQSMETERLRYIISVARGSTVEIMTHAANQPEFELLQSNLFQTLTQDAVLGNFAQA
jgi:predicted glycoside hydrolase/deacetylase ChbG (UPF0249 family)